MSPQTSRLSPPPLKRRRLSSSPPGQNPKSPRQRNASRPKTPSSHPVKTSVRVFSWNINGITPFLPPSTPPITNFLKSSQPCKSPQKPTPSRPSLRACLWRWNWPQFLCLQEVKIAPSDTKTVASVRRSVNAPLDDHDEDDSQRYLYDVHFCLPKDKYNATGFGGKVYGVCTLIRQDVPDVTVKSVEWDLEGRVLICEIPTWALVVMNIYAVNGTNYDYRDPASGKVVGNRHDRKRAFHSLLASEVKRYEEQGWGVIIAGDINISRTQIDSFPQLRMGEEHVANRADFENKLIEGGRILDTFRILRGEERKFTYRPRNKPWGAGGDRVDMVLVSKDLGGSLRDADILDTEERGPSDHVPLLVELEVGAVEGEAKVGD